MNVNMLRLAVLALLPVWLVTACGPSGLNHVQVTSSHNGNSGTQASGTGGVHQSTHATSGSGKEQGSGNSATPVTAGQKSAAQAAMNQVVAVANQLQ